MLSRRGLEAGLLAVVVDVDVDVDEVNAPLWKCLAKMKMITKARNLILTQHLKLTKARSLILTQHLKLTKARSLILT